MYRQFKKDTRCILWYKTKQLHNVSPPPLLHLMNHKVILGIFYSHTQFIRFYDISMLPNQTMDATAIKMAELITNV